MKIRMLETTYFEGKNYFKNQEYEVEESVASALGPSAREEKDMNQEKAVEKPKKDKMVRKAKVTK